MNQGLFSPFVVPVGTTMEALGRQYNFFMASMFGNAAFNSRQVWSPGVVPLTVGEQAAQAANVAAINN